MMPTDDERRAAKAEADHLRKVLDSYQDYDNKDDPAVADAMQGLEEEIERLDRLSRLS